MEFYASLFYKFFPYYCNHCGTLGHKEEKYRRLVRNNHQDTNETIRPRQNIEAGSLRIDTTLAQPNSEVREVIAAPSTNNVIREEATQQPANDN